eukprot:jgi/Psemu1/41166/gm1.41166_g
MPSPPTLNFSPEDGPPVAVAVAVAWRPTGNTMYGGNWVSRLNTQILCCPTQDKCCGKTLNHKAQLGARAGLATVCLPLKAVINEDTSLEQQWLFSTPANDQDILEASKRLLHPISLLLEPRAKQAKINLIKTQVEERYPELKVPTAKDLEPMNPTDLKVAFAALAGQLKEFRTHLIQSEMKFVAIKLVINQQNGNYSDTLMDANTRLTKDLGQGLFNYFSPDLFKLSPHPSPRGHFVGQDPETQIDHHGTLFSHAGAVWIQLPTTHFPCKTSQHGRSTSAIERPGGIIHLLHEHLLHILNERGSLGQFANNSAGYLHVVGPHSLLALAFNSKGGTGSDVSFESSTRKSGYDFPEAPLVMKSFWYAVPEVFTGGKISADPMMLPAIPSWTSFEREGSMDGFRYKLRTSLYNVVETIRQEPAINISTKGQALSQMCIQDTKTFTSGLIQWMYSTNQDPKIQSFLLEAIFEDLHKARKARATLGWTNQRSCGFAYREDMRCWSSHKMASPITQWFKQFLKRTCGTRLGQGPQKGLTTPARTKRGTQKTTPGLSPIADSHQEIIEIDNSQEIKRDVLQAWANADDCSQWLLNYKEIAQAGLKPMLDGPAPSNTDQQPPYLDSCTKALVKEKLSVVINKGCIELVDIKFVEAMMFMFHVPKGETDVRIVYNGTESGLNDALYAPCWFALPTMDSMLQWVVAGLLTSASPAQSLGVDDAMGLKYSSYNFQTYPKDSIHHGETDERTARMASSSSSKKNTSGRGTCSIGQLSLHSGADGFPTDYAGAEPSPIDLK